MINYYRILKRQRDYLQYPKLDKFTDKKTTLMFLNFFHITS